MTSKPEASSPPPQAETLERYSYSRAVDQFFSDPDGNWVMFKDVQAALASALPPPIPTPEEVDASISRAWEIHNHGYEQGKRVASEAALPPPPTETPIQADTLLAFVRRIAARSLCGEVDGQCSYDSGPYCGYHGTHEDADLIREARALLSTGLPPPREGSEQTE